VAVENNLLAAEQCKRLSRAAAESGRLLDCIYYHAVLRDWAALDDLGGRASERHPEDRFLYALLRGDKSVIAGQQLAVVGANAIDPWVRYTVVKALLQDGQISNAVSFVVDTIRRGECDVLPLNMIARFAGFTGQRITARAVAERSLALAPEQSDMRALLERVSGKGLVTEPPVLDLLPPRSQVAYYLPCYNVEEHIARTIESVLSLCHPLEELLVIDDGSPDNSITIAQGYPVRTIRHSENRGLATARNTAWQSADAEFLGTVDTDACPDPGYVKYALMEYEQGGPALAMAGGRLLEAYAETPADAFRSAFMKQDPGLARFHLDAIRDAGQQVTGESFKANSGQSFITGSDTLARRSALQQVGGYPERFRTNGEDAAICQMLRSRGCQVVFTPNCRATHYRKDTVTSVLRASWNYGYWFRVDSGYYDSAANLMEMLDDYTAGGHHFIMNSIEMQRTDMLYLEFLYPYHNMMLDVGHASDIGLITRGQGRTIQCELESVINALDARFHGNLLEKVLRDLPRKDFGSEVAPEPLDPDARRVLDQNLALMRQDQETYNAPFYQLLIAG